jgi:LemA protein
MEAAMMATAGAGTAIAALLLAAVIVALAMYFVGIYNDLVALRSDVDRSFANIEVLLKQRHDELPKLIDSCKGYLQYEQKTLTTVTQARTAYLSANTPEEKIQADSQVSGALKTLFAVAERYPDLKADANFLQLQDRITGLEQNIAGQRAAFNRDANEYNIRVAQVPANFVAALRGFPRRPLFQAAPGDTEDVEVSFG